MSIKSHLKQDLRNIVHSVNVPVLLNQIKIQTKRPKK